MYVIRGRRIPRQPPEQPATSESVMSRRKPEGSSKTLALCLKAEDRQKGKGPLIVFSRQKIPGIHRFLYRLYSLVKQICNHNNGLTISLTIPYWVQTCIRQKGSSNVNLAMAPLLCELFLYNLVRVRCFNWIFLHKPEHDLREHYDECHEYSSSRETRDVSGLVARRPQEDSIDWSAITQRIDEGDGDTTLFGGMW